MVRKQMFDNIMKVYRANISTLLNVTQSVELDLDIPRGYIAKIKKVIFGSDGNMSGVGDNTFVAAVVRDPDDDETVGIPDQDSEHDVIADFRATYTMGTLTTGNHQYGINRQMIEFDQELDVVSARNLRFNANGITASPTLDLLYCEVYYTLEAVSDELVLDLLDIL